MSAQWKGYWLLGALLVSISIGPAYAAGSLDALIAKAETARSSDPKSFQRLLGQLEAQVDSADEAQKDRIAYLKAYGLIFEGKAEAGITVAKALGESTKDADLALRATLLTVNAYALNRQFTEGLRQLEKAMQRLPAARSKEIRHQGLGVAAVLNQQIGQYRQALDYADRILRDVPDGRTRCLASQVQIESRQFLGLLPADDATIHGAIEHCNKQKEFAAANFIRIALARKWVEAGETQRAIDLIEKHLGEIERAKYPHLVAEAKAFLAEQTLEKGDLSAAENYARGVLSQSAGVTSTLPLVKAYRTLYDIAERNGDTKGALVAYQSYAEADKAYLNEVKARELAYQIVRQETLQKTQQISLLDQQNQVLQLQRKVDQQAAQNTRLIVILLIVLVASIGYWAFKIKRVQLSLKKMAETDALTGICNRHHFTIRAERALAECARNGEQAALIMFDLDHFKNINDRFGHGTGDWALKEVSEASKGFCRRIDVIGRLGGEEFAILMYGCDLRAAARVAEDCRVRLAQIDTRETGHVFAITGSFGVTSSMQSGYSLAKLLSHADKQLYRAKHQGRNRVCVYEPTQEHAREASNVLELPTREGRAEHHIGA
ncbi:MULTISPECIES: GGDEF domain-containing protein [unclassified Pseudoxanthomonas]|uniref:sensor domain-containing diguanylate cyclase n=1 Tax=unclassified Pseudoxanthomonas TaxID=2645906 RepID=UPI0008E4EA2A|nr:MULTISPECIES: GGDEF domain-containing protein [unclassified Pseudoxanthomonas]PPJ42557.1 GGDEF domain-containing protein [Pseudoxanthomonas sp. KAs_5_3]SFV26892.1 diguanylate cyclase (GGDEF) domain-containing protein [Pseudoxanthomonas sp. YR558]